MLNNSHSSQIGRSSDQKLRVVSIAHSAFIDGTGRLRYDSFADDSQVHLTLVIPDRWNESGRSLERGKINTRVELKTMKILFPSFPKANWYFHFYPGMDRMIDELCPDVLHLWEEPWSVVAAQAAYLCRKRGIALVLETEQNVLRPLPFPFERLRRYALARTNLLVSRQDEALNVSRACGYTGPAAIVEYCVDQTRFRPLDQDLAKSMFDVTGFTIGYVGRLIREKGLFTVLDALKTCRQHINFVMVGSGKASDDLRSRIQELGLGDRVRILPSQSQDGVATFMNSLSALILMSETTRSWKEQFGRVIIEAQACGVPVIGSSSGAIPSVIGGGGWIVPEGNSLQLAELLDKLASDPAQIAGRAVKATENVERFSKAVIAESLRNAWFAALPGSSTIASNQTRSQPVLSAEKT